jgi:hypothetical protein
MKKKHLHIPFILLALSSLASAQGYIERLRGIDQSVVCLIMWFAPAIVVVLFALGGFLYSTGNPTNRSLGKSYMLNSFAGLFLVLAFLAISFALVPTLTVDKCLGEAEKKEKTCESAGGKCACPAGQVCKSGSCPIPHIIGQVIGPDGKECSPELSDVSDCPDTCCKACAVPEKTCQEYGNVCGDCPTGKKCMESAAPGCDSGVKCCECVDEETCETSGLTCGCDTAAGEVCQPGTEKENVGTCAKCCKCIKPCSGTFGTNCCTSQYGLLAPCSVGDCHDDPGCHYFYRPAKDVQTCHSCCSSTPVKTCDEYLGQSACELNPCAISKGGWVPTDCVWTTCDLGATSIPCCLPK